VIVIIVAINTPTHERVQTVSVYVQNIARWNCRHSGALLNNGMKLYKVSYIKSSVFWDMMPCSPLEVNRRFGVTSRLHLRGRRISQGRKV
jgi:hypothetical protein